MNPTLRTLGAMACGAAIALATERNMFDHSKFEADQRSIAKLDVAMTLNRQCKSDLQTAEILKDTKASAHKYEIKRNRECLDTQKKFRSAFEKCAALKLE